MSDWKNNRPPHWEEIKPKPHEPIIRYDAQELSYITGFEDGYEAGANAILEVLKKAGKFIINYAGDSDPNLHRNGWQVFIPEESK